MPQKPHLPTYTEALTQILAPLQGPIAVDEVISRLLEIRPSAGKNPRQSARTQIRQHIGSLLVFTDSKHILPLRLALARVQFRIRLTRKDLLRGYIPFTPFLPYFFFLSRIYSHEVPFVDEAGQRISPTAVVNLQTFQFFDALENPPYLIFKTWFKQHKARKGDHLIAQLEVTPEPMFRISLERASDFNPEAVAARDRELADILYEMLEKKSYERLDVDEALPTAYARLSPGGAVPHPFDEVIDADERMRSDGFYIKYSDGALSPLERLVAEIHGLPTTPPPQKFSPEEGEQVYRFRICPRRRGKRRCARVEILGKQEMADLNHLLTNIFHSDEWDHLGGFWKLIPRGGSKRRYREVEVATVNPFGDGAGADTPIAGLGLKVGDRLKWVYDFGDWHEYRLELETIEEQADGVEYPREL